LLLFSHDPESDRASSVRGGNSPCGLGSSQAPAPSGTDAFRAGWGRDQDQTSQEKEDGSRGCKTSAEAPIRRSFSADLGTQSGGSGSAATAVTSASAGADADADHESAASAGDEREPVLEGKTVERTRASRIGEASISFLGQPSSARITGTLGPDESCYRRVNCSCRKRSQEATGSVATDDASWVGPLTALAFVLIIGTPERFGCAKQICNDVILDRHRPGGQATRFPTL